MSWSPKIAKIAPQGELNKTRPWVAVAEENAEQAVKFFVSILNGNHPVKLRMEAATRILQIAGATFRGEKRDGQGRPAANLPSLSSGGRAVQMGTRALSEALRQLPPGQVVLHPEEMSPGKSYVVLHDGDHNRKPQGCNPESPVGGVVKLINIEEDDGE